MSTKYGFYKFSPSGNTTILITSPKVETNEERKNLAKRFLDELHLGGEQVGYVSEKDGIARLDMMGGEFCGNATRSLASYLAWENSPLLEKTRGKSWEGQVSVSGVERLLQVKVWLTEDGMNTQVQMPIRADLSNLSEVQIENKMAHVVRMDGIVHVILGDEFAFPKSEYAEYAKRVRQQLDLENEEAVGCIWYKQEGGAISIQPVVWVNETDTTYYESACGSGTVAVALLQSFHMKGDYNRTIKQPSGKSITALVKFDSQAEVFVDAWIGGVVGLIARGETFLS